MAAGYVYSNVGTAEAPSTLMTKITDEVGTSPTSVQLVGSYAYIAFASALSSGDKDILDGFMSAREGVFEALDNTPSASVGGIARSPDTSLWKLTVDDAGVLTPIKIE